ncbi:MAG: extracellular solute-binding protein [Proteobacteria bacterium]|nr:extracellular solute-binding protein [Pseudomonadota bacterium]MBI3499819.1 extracellular solute-binding protein [Pseudomonadota bacterium]
MRAFRAALAGILGLLGTDPAASAQTMVDIRASSYIKPVYEQLVTEFNQSAKGIAAKFTVTARDEEEAVQQLLRSGLVGSDVPDVLYISGTFVRLLADRGLAVDLDPLIKSDPNWSKQGFTEAVAAAGRVNGRTYGLAFGLSMPVVLFNSELVRKAGGDPGKLPGEWSGILSLAKKIDALGSSNVGGFLEHDNGGSFSLLFLLESHGGQMLSADEKKVTLKTPQGLKALEVLRGFGESGQARASMTRDQARQAFGAGNLGVFVTMSSTIPAHEQASAGHFEVLSVPFPIAAAEGKLPAAGPIGVMLTHDPAKQKAAFELMKFASGPRGQTILATGSGYAPVNEIAIKDASMLGEVLSKRKNAHSYIARLNVATSWYAPPGDNAIKISRVVKDDLEQVVTLRMTPEQALDAMTSEIQPLLPKQ